MPGTVPGSSILEYFSGAKVFITGGTGFLGKALIEKLLRVFHNIDHVYILIRSKKGKDPMTRMKDLFDDPVSHSESCNYETPSLGNLLAIAAPAVAVLFLNGQNLNRWLRKGSISIIDYDKQYDVAGYQPFSQLFNTLRKEKPDFEKKATCIFGDVSSLRLGMSDADYSFLTGEVTHVIHSAATVRFNEKLKTALEINVLGTHEMSIFCNKCVRLKVFVHISTAYAHCVRAVIGEDFYDPPLSGEKALNLLKTLNEEKLNSLTAELIKPWPNTYSYTKSIGEHVVKENCKSIPAVIFRPGIVMGTAEEPVRGWIDNIYGPTGVIVAVGVGLMRVMYADQSRIANIIPVDMTVNAILSCAWETGNSFHNSIVKSSINESKESGRIIETNPRIYNFVADEANSVTWGEFTKVNMKHGIQAPSVKAIWYYTLTMTKVKFIYLSLILLLHHIPAIITDMVLILLGKKPQMMKAYQKIHSFTDVMVFFAINSWRFKNPNLKKLWSRLSDTDKELFHFDMTKMNWDEYFSGIIKGIREYIFNETDHSLLIAKKKMFFFWLGHRLIQFCFIAFWLWILAKCFFTFDSPKSQFKDSIPMPLDLFVNSTK